MKAWIAAILIVLACPAGALAQPDDAARFAATTLDLSAQGEVRAAPDLAVIDVGVQAQAITARAAFAQARTQMNAIFAAMHGQGIKDDDIQTSDISLQAQYADEDGKGPRRLNGYEASNTVSVRLHDLTRIGSVVDALVAAGANQINGVRFTLADPKSAEDQARRLAVRALQAKAELYAQATGYHVKRLVSLSEAGGGGPVMPEMALSRMRAFAATPVAAGELTVRSDVSATFELTR